MNERIKQIAQRAGFDFGRDWQVIGQSEDSLKVFAKLIVQECVSEIKNLRDGYATHRDIEPEEYDWYVDAFIQTESRLKNIFGVE